MLKQDLMHLALDHEIKVKKQKSLSRDNNRRRNDDN